MADFPTAWFYIKSVCSKKVIQPLGGSFEPTRLVVVDQKFGQESAAQLWKHENGYLVNKLTNLCLDYEHGNYKRLGDIHVCQWHQKVGKDAHNQKWLYRTSNLIASNDDINRVLDIKGGSIHPGAEVLLKKLETIKGAHPAHQRWLLEVIDQDGLPDSLSTYQEDQIAGSYAAPVEHVNPWATLEPSTDDEPGEAQTTYY
ncbi:uncharacterized protein PGTG_05737 [Puccinia graminis f. sp. tritici CRL 75-36-700-3]|uniref:Ricin B lectin domain-containing protein n=1 Tax=Puccinia graminis f. sp. tritici (strain CRL 75-36-700-3 / race SCCL) TaxID=418459 RepID=E3K4D8_PUCGT|nr:uncharacterized protein PGTG_05737 [Puccinia graminis f. sp. tritici CRL 75-36-700-3]EFP79416.1 hypothetical protein PGTG_05737 [Puccinia graminis f. sp. tritici CRL 75-36-700-3]